MWDYADKPAIVIDNGSGMCKAGFGDNDYISTILPTVIGRSRYGPHLRGKDGQEFYVGNEIQSWRDVLSLEHPVQRGVVTNWDSMEQIWNHVFVHELHANSEEQSVLVTEAALNPKGNREYLAQLMFESFNVPSLHVAISGAASMYALGRSTGIVLDCGDGVTQAIPFYDGCQINHAIRRLDFGGSDVTSRLQTLLNRGDYSFATSSDMECVREMKQQICYTAFDYQEGKAAEKRYTLPDGQTIAVGNECFQAPEILFQPPLAGKDFPGIHRVLYESIMACDCDIRSNLFIDIKLSGGATKSPGFHERVDREMRKLIPQGKQCMIFAPPDRELSAWIGGSILSSLSSFARRAVTKREYDEVGPFIMHRKTC